MDVIKVLKTVSNETLDKLKSFDYEEYETEMNSDENRNEMKDFLQLVSKNESEAIELSKQIRIK